MHTSHDCRLPLGHRWTACHYHFTTNHCQSNAAPRCNLSAELLYQTVDSIIQIFILVVHERVCPCPPHTSLHSLTLSRTSPTSTLHSSFWRAGGPSVLSMSPPIHQCAPRAMVHHKHIVHPVHNGAQGLCTRGWVASILSVFYGANKCKPLDWNGLGEDPHPLRLGPRGQEDCRRREGGSDVFWLAQRFKMPRIRSKIARFQSSLKHVAARNSASSAWPGAAIQVGPDCRQGIHETAGSWVTTVVPGTCDPLPGTGRGLGGNLCPAHFQWLAPATSHY
mmetsp:Transcript_99095/g.167014  ORF Transcript_99095/g.167014 Transcript_99095/m.167014 type:complete len:278 (+) Transcript_99095:415-1248(+)